MLGYALPRDVERPALDDPQAAGEAVSAEIIGPFQEYHLIVDGYSVPFVQAHEDDGGLVTFIMDSRLAWTVPAGAFEDVAHLIATAYALGVGLPCAPSADFEPPGMHRLPAVMRPRRTVEIGSVSLASEDESDA